MHLSVTVICFYKFYNLQVVILWPCFQRSWKGCIIFVWQRKMPACAMCYTSYLCLEVVRCFTQKSSPQVLFLRCPYKCNSSFLWGAVLISFMWMRYLFVANVFLIELEILRLQCTPLRELNHLFILSLTHEFLNVQYKFNFWHNEISYITSFVSVACWKVMKHLWELIAEIHFIFSIST